MAGVTKRPNSKYWWAIFYDGAGQKTRRSTKMENRKDAMDVARKWEELARAGRDKRLIEEQCRRVVTEIAEKYGGQKIAFHSTRDWLTEWLEGKKPSVADRTYKRWEMVVREFLEYLGPRADLTIRAINVTDVRGFRDSQAKSVRRSNATVNQTIRSVLSLPFHAARKLGYIENNPCLAVPLLPSEKVTRDTFTPEQVAKLLSVASEEWRGMILGGFYTALRLRDVANLRADNISADTISIVAIKTKRLVRIPLHPAFARWIAAQRITSGNLFPNLAGRSNASELSEQFAGIMAKAGIAGRRLREGRGRKTSSLSFHSLRHSMNSALANAGVDREVRKALTGHLDDRSHDLYTHHSEDSLRAAINKLPAIRE